MEERLVAEARAMAREGIARLVRASQGNTPVADAAASALVAALLEGADEVRSELTGRNQSYVSLLEVATTWPTRWFPHARDQELQVGELRRLGYGKATPLNVARAWQNSPGTRWAYDYWRFVFDAKMMAAAALIDRLVTKAPDNRSSLRAAVSLPPLVRHGKVVAAWFKGAMGYYNELYPGEQLASHPDWSKTKGGEIKIRERIEDGLWQIAPGVRRANQG